MLESSCEISNLGNEDVTQPRLDHPQNRFWLAEAKKANAAAEQLALTPGVIGKYITEIHQVDGIIKRVVQKTEVEPIKQEKA